MNDKNLPQNTTNGTNDAAPQPKREGAPLIPAPADALVDAIAPYSNCGPGTEPSSVAAFADCALDAIAEDLAMLAIAVNNDEEPPTRQFISEAIHRISLRARAGRAIVSALADRERDERKAVRS